MSISFTGLSCVKGSMAKTNRQILVTAPSFRKGESTLKSYDRHPWGPYFFRNARGYLIKCCISFKLLISLFTPDAMLSALTRH